MATPGSIQGGRGNLPNTHFWHDLKKKKASQKPIFFSKWLRYSILATPGLNREGRGESTKYPLMSQFEKCHQKPIFFFKMAKILHTGNTWLESGGEGGNLPNTHLWRILKKKPPKNGAKMAKTDWQLEFVYRTSDMLVLLPKICRSCCS